MPDYGHDLLFGTILTPDAARPGDVVRLAKLTEQLDLDLVSVPDHPYQPGFLDAWTLLTFIAANTTRVHVLPNVANLPLRPPAGLARSAASLDVLSGGRADLGLGTGAYWEAIAGEGGPHRSPAQAVDALAEAIRIMRALWTPGPPRLVAGEHYSLRGARPGPYPRHDIAIWIGAIKPRMLRLIGTLADGWLPSATRVPPAQLRQGNRLVDETALAAGRTPHDVRRLYNIPGIFGTGPGFLHGPPRVWAEQLAELTLDQGISGYLFPSDDAGTIRRFAQEVVPDVRERVEHERGQPGSEPATSAPESSSGRARP